MNNTKETLSSVKDVLPDIGSDFELNPAVIAGRWMVPFSVQW